MQNIDNGFKLVKKSLNQFKFLVRDLKHRLFYGRYQGDILYVQFDPDKMPQNEWCEVTLSMDDVKAIPFRNWKEEGTIFSGMAKININKTKELEYHEGN